MQFLGSRRRPGDSRSRSGKASVSAVQFLERSGTPTCMSMAFTRGSGPETNPIRSPEERIFDKLSKRNTRPTSGCSNSSVK